MKNEMIKKIESAKNYLKRWKADTNDQITKNHIASVFNTLCNIENLANGLSTCDGQLTQPAVIKSVCPKCGNDKYFDSKNGKIQCRTCGKWWRKIVL